MTRVRTWTLAIVIGTTSGLLAADQTLPSPGATTVTPVTVDMETEWAAQYTELVRQIALGERLFPQRARETVFRQDALILSSDRDPADVVLRRATTLLGDIGALSGALFGGMKRSSRKSEEQRWQEQQRYQAQQQQQQVQQQQQQRSGDYRRAYSVCMTSRNYKVQ